MHDTVRFDLRKVRSERWEQLDCDKPTYQSKLSWSLKEKTTRAVMQVRAHGVHHVRTEVKARRRFFFSSCSEPQSMPDSFFTSNKPRKRKRTEPSSLSSSSKSKKTRHAPNAGSKSTKSKRLDEDLDSDQTSDAGDNDDLRAPSDVEGEVEGEDDPNETPAEKRLRLAQLYLDGVKEDLAATQGEIDAAEIDKELISSRLRGVQYKGKVHLFVAEEFAEASCSQLRVKGHRLSCTAAVASPVASSSGYHLFTAGKEGHIFKWDLQNGKQIAAMYKVKPEKGKGKSKGKGKAYPAPTAGHTSSVTSLALTTDGSYLASGAMDSRAGLWDARVCRWITGFSHKDTVSVRSIVPWLCCS